MNPQRRRCLHLGAALALAGAWPLRAQEPAGFETSELDWADERRQRRVPVRLYLPQRRGALPLVVFSHGMGGSRRGYSWLGQHFAGHGIASLHLQHVGSDNQLWGGNVWDVLGRVLDAAQEREAIARALDLRFALDTLLAGDGARRFDTRRIVAAGHSYGANTALLASGAHIERAGRVVDLRDARVAAAIVISAPPFYGEAEPRKVLQAVTVPSLHVTATEDIIRIPGFYSGVDDRVAVFEATGGVRKWLAVFEGGSHSMFTDRGLSGGAVLNPQVKLATRALTLAFLHRVFDGDDSALRQWPQQHAAILARFTAAAA